MVRQPPRTHRHCSHCLDSSPPPPPSHSWEVHAKKPLTQHITQSILPVLRPHLLSSKHPLNLLLSLLSAQLFSPGYSSLCVRQEVPGPFTIPTEDTYSHLLL